MLSKYLADLHVHSALSPCAEKEMTIKNILELARDMGLQILAISDHNSSANVFSAMQLAKQYGIMLIPAMEVESREEAHILTLFPNYKSIEAWQSIIDTKMSGLENDIRRFGRQIIFDQNDQIVGEESRMLLGPVKLSAQEIVEFVGNLGGICIPAHIDRPAFSLLGQLGFITKNQGYLAVEVSTRGFDRAIQGEFRYLTENLDFICNSDAHNLKQFLEQGKTEFYLQELSFREFKQALQAQNGRYTKALKSIFNEN